MPIPAEGYPLAAAVSPRVEVVETTDSTNADVVAAVAADPDAWPHLSLRLTTDQRAGRGRLDRTWTAPPGTALAVSVVVDVAGIPAGSRGWLPLIAGAAMADAVGEQLRGRARKTTVKWPNDVLVDGRKISGILAEAVPGHPDRVVVGAGVNTSMTAADLPVADATSFAVIDVDVEDDRLLAAYLRTLDRHVRALAGASGDAEASGVRAAVQDACGTVGQHVRVALPDGRSLEGEAVRLDAGGRLVVRSGDDEEPVAAGDVVHVR